MDSNGIPRIGELSKRSRVSPDLLSGWERSAGGLRPYPPADVVRVRVMRQHLGAGLAASEAAALASRTGLDDEAALMALHPGAMRKDLADALDRSLVVLTTVSSEL